MGIDSLPYVHAAGDGGPRGQTQMVVIHDTGNTASDTAEANYASHRPDRTSAHIYVDGDSATRALPLGNVAYGCHPTGNARSVQFELVASWSDATMRVAAPLVAEACRRYGIPIRKVGPDELKRGEKGICGHGDVTLAWREGDHMDPGPRFDWGKFVGLVAAAAGGAPAPAPAPAPAGTPFPLPSGHYYGDIAGDKYSHGGYYADERPTVARIQRRLQALGYAPKYAGWADGKFERPTVDAVKAFQRTRGLVVDGEVGPVTWRALGL